MHFFLPRRHRRHLLFPSGLLALAGLLWLGSMAIMSWQEKLKMRSVVQLTVPILHPSPITEVDDYRWNKFSRGNLTPFHNWKEMTFDGRPKDDSINASSLIKNLAKMQAEPLRDQRIRLTFGPHSTYAEMVYVLNLMLKYDIKKYVFDNCHTPIIFYAFTVLPFAQNNPKPEFIPFCGTSATMMLSNYQPSASHYWSAPYLSRFGHWVAALWNPKLKDTSWYTSASGTGTEYDITLKLERQYLPELLNNSLRQLRELPVSFRQSEWRIQFLLIIGMIAISWWKIKYQLQSS